MAENSPLRRNRPNHQSPRKHPYEKSTTAIPIPPTQTGRSPLRDIQGKHVAIHIPSQTKLQEQVKKPLFPTKNEEQQQHQPKQFSHFGGPSLFQKSTTDRILPLPLTTCKIFTDENAQEAKKDFGAIGENRRSLGFIPVDKSCVIGGNGVPVLTSAKESQQNDWASGMQSVTTGVLGQLQPRGLNTSFTEKFESRLGINSDEPVKRQLGGTPVTGILTQQFIPLFDFPEYSTEILKSWGVLEKRHRVKHNYMERHKDISHKMRSILIDWIAEVVGEYDMMEETLHLAVNYLDRFLGHMNVERTKLQLVGTAALMIAAKFEEMHPPETADYVFVTDDAFTKDQILKMEQLMLTILNFDLMVPTAHDFAISYCSILKLSDPIKCLAMYLVDLSIMDGETYLKYLPSVVAGAAVVLGRFTFDKISWDAKIQGICTHRRKTVFPCVRELQQSFFNASSKSQTTIYEKYQSVKYCQISQAFIPANGPWYD